MQIGLRLVQGQADAEVVSALVADLHSTEVPETNSQPVPSHKRDSSYN